MPPTSKPLPRFIADSPQESLPSGRFAERLGDELAKACEPLTEEAGSPVDAESIRWFPERTWGERVYVPATAPGTGPSADGHSLEYYGYVSFERPSEGEPQAFRAHADFTDVTAEDAPDWRIDLSDAVIGHWRSDRGRGGDVTLVWGLPLVSGAVAATAEIEGEALDQIAIDNGRFTMIAVDAVTGFGDPRYVEIHLWDRRLRSLAAETLYETGEESDDESEADDAGNLESDRASATDGAGAEEARG